MKAAGGTRHGKLGRLISLAVIAIAIGIGIVVSLRSRDDPSTDDATIDADVVHVAAAVGGRVIRIGVSENAEVRKGDLLFQIDPLPYQLAVRQAASALDVARAANQTQNRTIATQQSVSQVTGSQIARATENLGLAQRTAERLRPLVEKGYVPRQQYDQAIVATQDAATSLRQARDQNAGARAAIDTDAGSAATIRAGEAALAIARRALDDTVVRASHPGRVVGLTVSTGEMVAPSQSMFTLIKSDEWFVMANFRETSLKHIAIGDCATVYSMVDRAHAIRGTVQGIGSGVLDDERVNLPRELPYVQRSLNWVRVEQRFPVRIRLIHPPQALMRLSASAVVEVRHGSACR
jgi:multidrug efflux system membrane fusion protein